MRNRRYRTSSGVWCDRKSIRTAGEEDLGEFVDFQEVGVVGVDTCREEGEGLAVVGEEEGVPLAGTIGQK
jgi:hypothetical protein